MIHLAYLQRPVVGQKQLRSRPEFYFDGNFLGGEAISPAEINNRSFCLFVCFMNVEVTWSVFVHRIIYAFCNKNTWCHVWKAHFGEESTVTYLFSLATGCWNLWGCSWCRSIVSFCQQISWRDKNQQCVSSSLPCLLVPRWKRVGRCSF